MHDGELARFYPANPSPPSDPAFTSYGPTQGASPPPTVGAVFQIIDPGGVLEHELAAFGAPGAGPKLIALPDVDGTRAFILPRAGAIPAGFWTLRCVMKRDNGPGDPVWSVSGDTSPETAVLRFWAD
jgi:hypothetical protein